MIYTYAMQLTVRKYRSLYFSAFSQAERSVPYYMGLCVKGCIGKEGKKKQNKKIKKETKTMSEYGGALFSALSCEPANEISCKPMPWVLLLLKLGINVESDRFSGSFLMVIGLCKTRLNGEKKNKEKKKRKDGERCKKAQRGNFITRLFFRFFY